MQHRLGFMALRQYMVSFQGCFIIGTIVVLVAGINTINLFCKSQANGLPALDSAFQAAQNLKQPSQKALVQNIQDLKAQTKALLAEVPPSMEQEVGFTPLAVDKIPTAQFIPHVKHDPFAPILKTTHLKLTLKQPSSAFIVTNDKNDSNNRIALALTAPFKGNKTED